MLNLLKEPCCVGKCNTLKVIAIASGLITIFWIVCVMQRIDKIICPVRTSAFGSLNTLKSPPMEGIRKHIYESKWIRLFPHLKKMVEVVKDGSKSTITNPTHTSINVLNKDNLHVGGQLHADITSCNRARRRKAYGGDFFAVTLRRPGSQTDGVTCEITDKTNGKYSVSCILPWEGAAIVDARLIHPSETIFQLMKRYSSEKEFRIHQKTTMLNSKNQTVTTACSVGFPNKSPDELCDYSNPSHGEKRTCLRPSSGECPKVILYQTKVTEDLFPRITRWHNLYCTIHNYLAPILGSGVRLHVKSSDKTTEQHYINGNLSQFNVDPMTPSGWQIGGKWTSIKSDVSYNLDLKTLEKCISHKRLHFFGDSTARNIYSQFVARLNITDSGLDNRVAWSRGRDGVSKLLNMTIQYRSHGPPLNNPGPEDARPYMSDSFDAIREGGNGTIVMFTIGYHFHFFDPDVYLRRIGIIKQAVLSFLSRLPGSKVIVKGLHYHWEEGFLRSPWLTYRIETILRHEFRDIRGLTFLENYDYCQLHKNGVVHPKMNVLLETIKMLMPHMC